MRKSDKAKSQRRAKSSQNNNKRIKKKQERINRLIKLIAIKKSWHPALAKISVERGLGVFNEKE